MKFFDKKKFVSRKILEAIALDGLLQSSDLAFWLQEERIVNQQQNSGLFTPKTGTFVSQKTKKEMQWESSGERVILEALDVMPEVKWFNTQCIKFPYTANDDEYDYYPDIVCRMDYNQVIIIEVKPTKYICDWRNYRKYIAGKYLCAKNDWHYIILSSREGTIEDMAAYHVAQRVERDFMDKITSSPAGKYGGVRLDEIIQFKKKYEINDQTVAAIALRNDLTFYEKPSTCTKLEAGYSWTKILRKPF